MIVRLQRRHWKNRAKDQGTPGTLFINDEVACCTLEPSKTLNVLQGPQRLLAGVYPIELYKAGRIHKEYKNKFPEFHVGMLLIKAPNRSGIEIHIGNLVKHTLGCILTGSALDDSVYFLGNSIPTYESIYKKISRELLGLHKVTLDIRDEID